MTKQKKPYQGSARQLRRLANRKPDAQPARTAVKATCTVTGHVSTYDSIRKCADVGGFDYTSIRAALSGRLPSHAGHTFEALTPLRKEKPAPNLTKVAELRNKGMSNQEIADELSMTIGTVAVYACQAVHLKLTKKYRDVLEDLAFAKHGL
ncbi:hypothetical protein [Aeromonas phage 32]|nr:hypothetical protein [Aeromonas phage 32]